MLLLITLMLCDMSQETKAKLISIATKARKLAERYADRHVHLTNLKGVCGVASAHLFKLLDKEGIKAELAFNQHHVFVLAYGYLIDITATQFDGQKLYTPIPLEKVIVEKYNNIERCPTWWKIEATFDSIIGLGKHQQEKHWPNNQIPKCIPLTN